MADTPRSTPVSFAEFEPLTTAAWQERIRRDLKGADPAALVWQTPEGFPVEPFYHREALTALGTTPAPQVRSHAGHAPNSWLNIPTLSVPAHADGHAQIDHAADALQRGADGVHFDLADAAHFDLRYLAARLPLNTATVGFTISQTPDAWLQRLLEAAPNAELRGFLRYAPGQHSSADDYAQQTNALRRCVQLTRHLPGFLALAVNGVFFNNRGASATQELAYTLSTASSFLYNLPDHKTDLLEVASSLQVCLAVGTSYFMEIAKLRAIRRLWATLLHAYGLPPEVAAHLRVHATTSSWTQTTLDPHTNLLRVTTEAMSAVLGGADSVSVTPFDSLYAGPNDFSARIARNVPVILREEAYLDRVTDPAAGSYYLETLTDQLAREAWAMFQRIEAAGGILVNRGHMLDELRHVAMEKFHRIANGQQVIVGTNRFQNAQEQFDYDPKALLRSRHFDTTRAAYPTEVLRLATALHFIRREQKKKKAAVVLLGRDTIGLIHDLYLRLIPEAERPLSADLPPEGTLSLLFSTPDAATLMWANEDQLRAFASFVASTGEAESADGELQDANLEPPLLMTADLATMQDAVRHFGFREFTVHGHSTDDVLARLQGR
ncbi:methylmalonyl-CoA mutase family protein [Hymenobacter koreensis]|uniref:Methylmalonyl-CoA mutase small subunit n=1 Tax=Hymenobacter koreensis TaxID=1084523 RepID=A0ABP8IVG2_9BACT